MFHSVAPAVLFRIFERMWTPSERENEIKTLKCLCREKHVLAMQEMVRSRKFTWWWVTCVNMKIHFYFALIYVSSTALYAFCSSFNFIICSFFIDLDQSFFNGLNNFSKNNLEFFIYILNLNFSLLYLKRNNFKQNVIVNN